MVDPEVERRKIKVPKIRSSNVEIGINDGFISIEDFGTQNAYGLTAAYHVTEDFFFWANTAVRMRAAPASRPWRQYSTAYQR